jgi:hypothetical protein
MAKTAAEKRAEALTKAFDTTNDKLPEVQLTALKALQEPEKQVRRSRPASAAANSSASRMKGTDTTV